MGKFTSIQNSFSSGELSPKLDGRTELQEYKDGAAKLENAIPYGSGGAFRRPGSIYQSTIPNLEEPFLIQYRLGIGDYILAIEPNQDVQLEAAGTCSVADDEWTIGGHGLEDDDIVMAYVKGGTVPTGMTANTKYYVVTATTNTFQLSATLGGPAINITVQGTGYIIEKVLRPIEIFDITNDAWIDSETNIIWGTGLDAVSVKLIISILNTLDKDGFQYTQDGDVLFITHSSGLMEPIVVYPNSDASNFYVRHYKDGIIQSNLLQLTVQNIIKMPMLPPNITALTMTPSATTGNNQTLTASSAYFEDGHIGAFFAVTEGNYVGYCVVKGIQSSTVADIDIIVDFASVSAIDDWREGAWSDAQGWPRAVTMFQGRMSFGGTTQSHDSVWWSVVNNSFICLQGDAKPQDGSVASPYYVAGIEYYSGDEGQASDNAFRRILGGPEIDNVQWMSSGRSQHVGSDYIEYTFSPIDGIFDWENVDRQIHTSHGGSGLQPARIDRASAFISGDGKRIIDFRYSDDNGSNLTRNLSLLSDYLLYYNYVSGSPSYRRMVWQDSWNTLWVRTSSDQLIGVVIEDSSKVIAWHKHTFGGTDVKVTGMCILRNSSTKFDEVWVSIQRTINSATVTYLEKVGYEVTRTQVDSSASSLNPASVTHSGFDHLEGETVDVLADFVYVGQKVVTAGDITLDEAADFVIAGLHYDTTIKTMKLEQGSQIGNSQIMPSRIDQILIKFFQTLSGQYGDEEDNLYDIEYDTVAAGETFTGDISMELDAATEQKQQVVIKQHEPYPMTVLGIVMRGFTQD